MFFLQKNNQSMSSQRIYLVQRMSEKSGIISETLRRSGSKPYFFVASDPFQASSNIKSSFQLIQLFFHRNIHF